MTLAVDLLGGFVVDDHGTRWADNAYDWQWSFVSAVLEPGRPRRVFSTRPRSGRKTTDVAACLVAALLTQAPAFAEGFHFSVDEGNAQVLIRAVKRIRALTPGLSSVLKVDGLKVTALARLTEDGRTEVWPESAGPTLTAMASDTASANGLMPWWLSVDELSHWVDLPSRRELWETISDLADKDDSCRLVVSLNAGSPSHFAKTVRDEAEQNVEWSLLEVPGPLPKWTEDKVKSMRHRMRAEPHKFERLHLNQWAGGSDVLAAAEDVAACIAHEGQVPPQPGHRYVIGVDLAVRRDFSAAVVCHTEGGEPRWNSDGTSEVVGRRLVVDVVQCWKPPRAGEIDLVEVESWLSWTARRYNAAVYMDEQQASRIAHGLQGVGVRARTQLQSMQWNSRAATVLFSLIKDHALRLPADEEFIEELRGLTLTETVHGTYRVLADRRLGRGHGDRTSALMHAAMPLLVGDESAAPVLFHALPRGAILRGRR